MSLPTLQEARAELVRERVMAGVAALLGVGDELTFANLTRAAKVPERTIYRYFPTRQALLAAVFDWTNQKIGFSGEPPSDGKSAVALVRRVFPGFDQLAPVIRELLVAPEGLLVRLSTIDKRRRAALALVRNEVPGLQGAEQRRVAAVIQLLTTASTWQTLRDYWGMDGSEAAEASALAIELLLEAARARSGQPPRRPRKTKTRMDGSSQGG